MPETVHFPRLATRGVKLLLDDLPDMAALDWKERRARVASLVSFAPTGGGRVPDSELGSIRQRLMEIAEAYGFPEDSQAARLDFDKKAAIALIEENLVSAPEAMRDDVWAFLASVLVADIVYWRWNTTAERYRGGVRNALQRLWLRAAALRRDMSDRRWELVETLSEDANLQILERPGLSGSRRVTRAVAESWLAYSRLRPAVKIEDITRRVSKTLLYHGQIRPLHLLTDTELQDVVAAHFERARQKV